VPKRFLCTMIVAIVLLLTAARGIFARHFFSSFLGPEKKPNEMQPATAVY